MTKDLTVGSPWTVLRKFCLPLFGSVIKCPALLFSSNGKPLSEHWIKCQKEFAIILYAKLISSDCGHYIHYFKSGELCQEIIEFIKTLER